MKETKKKKLLVFHPIIAPYRVDFFNALSQHYEAKIVLSPTKNVAEDAELARLLKKNPFMEKEAVSPILYERALESVAVKETVSDREIVIRFPLISVISPVRTSPGLRF